MKKIIIEGADCTGKTTFAKKLAGNDKTLFHYGIYRDVPVDKQFAFFRTSMDLPLSVVFDRCPLSEYIYSKYRGVKPWFTLNDIYKLIDQEYGECQIHFLIPNKKLIVKLCNLTDQPEFVRNNIVNIADDYTMLASHLTGKENVSVLDTTKDLEKAIKQLEKQNDNNSGLRNSADPTTPRLSTKTSRSRDQREQQ